MHIVQATQKIILNKQYRKYQLIIKVIKQMRKKDITVSPISHYDVHKEDRTHFTVVIRCSNTHLRGVYGQAGVGHVG